jgi:hypothetical protein
MFKFDPKHKFNNKKMETPDGVFDSKGEWQRWLFLKDAERRGAIKDLERQVKFVLLPTQYREEVVHLKTKDKIVKRVAEREVTYTADFVYRKLKNVVENQLMGRVETWEKVVEDFKGFPNDRWPLKKAMMLYFHGIAIREVKKPTEGI